MTQRREQVIFAGLLVVFAMMTRLLFNALHIYNFSAVMAAALFAGASLSQKRLGYLIPVVTMLLSDLVLGVYDWRLMSVVDGAFLFAILLGQFYSSRPTLLRWVGVVLGSSTLFFLVTNGAVWLFGGEGSAYEPTVAGLIRCYTMGLPFFRDRLIGDLFWSGALFGSYHLFELRATRGVARTSDEALLSA